MPLDFPILGALWCENNRLHGIFTIPRISARGEPWYRYSFDNQPYAHMWVEYFTKQNERGERSSLFLSPNHLLFEYWDGKGGKRRDWYAPFDIEQVHKAVFDGERFLLRPYEKFVSPSEIEELLQDESHDFSEEIAVIEIGPLQGEEWFI